MQFPEDHGQFSTEAIFDNLKWRYILRRSKLINIFLGGLLLKQEKGGRCPTFPLNRQLQGELCCTGSLEMLRTLFSFGVKVQTWESVGRQSFVKQ